MKWPSYDLEKLVFLSFLKAYGWWFFPPQARLFLRVLGNIVIVAHLAAVLSIGFMFANTIVAQTVPLNSLTEQIIKNSGRLDRLEDQQRADVLFENEMLKDLAEIKLNVAVLQQEMSMYRWGIGIIYVVLVGQLGVAVFSLLMRREADRQTISHSSSPPSGYDVER
jgi:hypothetical protein